MKILQLLLVMGLLALAGCSSQPKFKVGDCVCTSDQKTGRIVQINSDLTVAIQGYRFSGNEVTYIGNLAAVPDDWCAGIEVKK